MRIIVDLDPDVEVRLRVLAHERGVSFQEALNRVVRAGLGAGRNARGYRTPSRPLGLRPGISLDNALRLAADLEDAETAKHLERGKE